MQKKIDRSVANIMQQYPTIEEQTREKERLKIILNKYPPYVPSEPVGYSTSETIRKQYPTCSQEDMRKEYNKLSCEKIVHQQAIKKSERRIAESEKRYAESEERIKYFNNIIKTQERKSGYQEATKVSLAQQTFF